MKRLAFATPAIVFVIVAGYVAIAYSSQLGWWSYILGVATAAGLLSMVAYVTRDQEPTEAEELEFARATLAEQQTQLEKRELDLMNRLAVYHEWMEFPEPIDLTIAPSDSELSELAEKDRQLQALLSDTAEKLFNDILQNRYAPDGKVSLPLIREDAQQLAENVARVYNPDADQMLLKTNIEDILRASSRACLQMLTVLDLLPVDVRRQNIDDLYFYLRGAVQAFGVYKKAQPYWGYVNSAYYLGRLALGANPLSMGAWWVAGRVGRQAGQHITKRYVNRQAMTLIHHAIRVLGNEVACVYGAGFRHRDVNWIYAAELTELIAALPVSHRCLSQALRELGSLALRSEYDRVFLYRCIAEGLSARPDQYRAAQVLTPAERQLAAQRLERFANAYGGGASPKKLQKWITETEARLEVQLTVSFATDEDREVDPLEVARSLMAFLVEIKEHEPDEAWTHVVDSSLVPLTEDLAARCRTQWIENPAFFFELPDLAPGSEAARTYLSQLIDLAFKEQPRGEQAGHVIENAAAYLRIDESALQKLIVQRGGQMLADQLDGRQPKIPFASVVPLLDWLDQHEDARFLITGVEARWNQKAKQRPPWWDQLLILGDDDKLSAIWTCEGEIKIVWTAERSDLQLEKGGYLSGGFHLKGGRWTELANGEPGRPDYLAIRSGRFARTTASDDFRILTDWLEQHENSP